MLAIDCAYATHPGLKRQLNEDSYCIEPDLGLWCVADGMGGHASGEVASGLAVEVLPRLIRQGQTLRDAIRGVHRQIVEAARRGAGGHGMGSTLVAAQLTGAHYEVAWVGDSRAYRWDGGLWQITRDHSYVQLLFDAGLIEAGDMATHPFRNIISQALGGSGDKSIEVDTVSGELAMGDTLLLCSDGLNGEVTDAQIAAVLAGTADNRLRAEQLIGAALAAGGRDNITVVLLTALNSATNP